MGVRADSNGRAPDDPRTGCGGAFGASLRSVRLGFPAAADGLAALGLGSVFVTLTFDETGKKCLQPYRI